MLPRYTIIDEADEMVSADWVEDMTKIMGGGGMFKYIQNMSKILKTFQIPTKMRIIYI